MIEIRSVSVHLDADVASYIAKMKLAGEATNKAFSNSSHNIDTTNTSLGETEKTLGGVETQARKTGREVEGLDRKFRSSGGGIDSYAAKLDRLLGKVGLLPTALATIGPALGPVAGVGLGAGLSLGGPLLAAGAGVGGFALIAGQMIKQANAAEKKVAAADKAVATAHQALINDQRNYGKNTATVTNAQIKYNQALAAYKTQLDALTPEQRKFEKAKSEFGQVWQQFTTGKAGAAVFDTVVTGLHVAGQLLPSITPLMVSTSGALSGLLHDVEQFSKTDQFKQFDSFFSAESGKAIGMFGHLIGNLALGFGHLFQDLTPTGNAILRDFIHMTDGFAGGKSLKGFLGYFHDNAPLVKNTVHDLSVSFGHIMDAGAKEGPTVLRVVDGMSQAFNHIPIHALTLLLGVFTAGKVFQAAGGFKAIGAGSKVLDFAFGKGKGGLPGGIAKAGVVPVYVTNKTWPGNGGGPNGEPVPGKPGKPGKPGETPPGAPKDTVPNENVLKKTTRSLARWATVATSLDLLGHANAAAASTAKDIFPQIFGPIGRPLAWSVFHSLPMGPQFTDLPHLGPKNFLSAASSIFGGSGKGPDTRFPKPVGFNAWNPDAVNSKQVNQKLAAQEVKQQIADVSRAFDMIGPHAQGASAMAVKALDQLKAELFAIQHPVKFQIIANTASAIANLQRIQAMQIKDKHFNIYAQSNAMDLTRAPGGGMGRNPSGSADGSTIPGPRTPYGDKVLHLVAPGEEVVSNRYGQADRWRPLLKAINANRMADGGTAWAMGATSYARASTGHSKGSIGPLRMTIDLRTPWGTQTVSAIAREEIAAHAYHEEAHGV